MKLFKCSIIASFSSLEQVLKLEMSHTCKSLKMIASYCQLKILSTIFWFFVAKWWLIFVSLIPNDFFLSHRQIPNPKNEELEAKVTSRLAVTERYNSIIIYVFKTLNVSNVLAFLTFKVAVKFTIVASSAAVIFFWLEFFVLFKLLLLKLTKKISAGSNFLHFFFHYHNCQIVPT